MKLLIFVTFVLSSYSVLAQELENPFVIDNGLNSIEINKSFDSLECRNFSLGFPKYMYTGIQFNILESKPIPILLPKYKLQNYNLVGLPEGLYYLGRDIFSGLAK